MECNKHFLEKLIIFVCGVIAVATVFTYGILSFYKQWNFDNSSDQHYSFESYNSEEERKVFNVPVFERSFIGTKHNSTVPFGKRLFPKLSSYLSDFPWEELEASANTSKENMYRQNLIDGLQTYAFQAPMVPINHSCTPPPLLDPKDITCSDYPDAFLPNKYEIPVKVAHAIQLGFDADTLEIHLNEVYDVVDYFFILEATTMNCKILQKQLMWSGLSVQPRFVKFRNKIVHLVLDDVEVASLTWSKNDAFKHERLQEEMRWRKIKQWNNITNVFSGNDIIGFGDADEIASRKNVQLLKYCPLKANSLDIGIWFPFGRLDQAHKSSFPVSRRYRYTLGDPTFYRWKDIVSLPNSKYPTRKRGKSNSFLLGGIHLTYYTYVPYFMLRKLSATECGDSYYEYFKEAIKYLLDTSSLEVLENQVQRRVQNSRLKLLKDISEDLSKIVVFPWFYLCNSERYPSWEGKHDTRVT